MKNILFLFNTGDVVGGGEISFFDLLKNLHTDRFQPWIVCPKKGALVEKLKKSGFKVHLIQMVSIRSLNVFKIFSGIFLLWRYLKKNKIDLIHCNGSRCAIYAVLAAKLARIPVVWHVRIMDRDKWLDWFLVRQASSIVTNSQSVKGRFKPFRRAKNKVRVVYNGFDFEQFNAKSVTRDLRKEFSFSSGIPVIGMTGRMDWYKDYKTFLDAAKLVLDRFPTAQFLLAGSGQREYFLKQYAKSLQIANAVHFLGHQEEIVNTYAALDIFVLSTRSEGFGRVLVEALAMEKPVVATEVGGVVEIIKDGSSGLLVKKESAHQLAGAILKLIEDPKGARQLALWGNQEVRKRFSMERHVNEIEQVYQEALNGIAIGKIRLGIDWRESERGKSTGIRRYLEGVAYPLCLNNSQWELKFFGNQNTVWQGFIPENAKIQIPERLTPWWDQVTLPKAIRKEQCHLFLSPYFKAPLFSPSPLVLIVNDLIPIQNFYFRSLLRWNLKRATAVIAISHSVYQDVIRFYPRAEKKLTSISLGVAHHFQPGVPDKILLTSKLGIEKRYLLYVGNAHAHKNISSLIHAMKEIAHFDLVLCGVSVQQNPELGRLVTENHLTGRVHFLRRVSDENLLQLYRGAELFISPSLAEGFGLPPLEAMACGVPVIASQIPTNQEVLGEAALLVDAGKPKEITNAVNQLIGDASLKNELIEKGKERVKLFSEKKMAASFELLLRSIYEKHENFVGRR